MTQPYCPACKHSVPDGQMRACPTCGHQPITDRGAYTGWPRDALLGQRVAEDLHVVRLAGGGGFGRVYEVYRVGSSDRQPMALKVLNASLVGDLEQERQFLRELRLMMQIRHPNVVRCHRGGRLDNGALYMLMEMIHGHTLESLVEHEGALTPRRAAHIGAQIAEGLSAAHAHGVLHRDLKPDNLLVNDKDHTWLIDFGVGKELGEATSQRKLSRIIGTPMYMAPEQCRPGEPVDERLDLYQLGAVLHFMLTGKPPYSLDQAGINPAMELAMVLQLQQKRSGGPGPRPSDLEGELALYAADLDELVGALLALDPDDRPSRAIDVAQALRQIHAGLPSTPPTTRRDLPAVASSLEATAVSPSAPQGAPDLLPTDARRLGLPLELPMPGARVGIRDDTIVDPNPAGSQPQMPARGLPATRKLHVQTPPRRLSTSRVAGEADATRTALDIRAAPKTQPAMAVQPARDKAAPQRSQVWLWLLMLVIILTLAGGALGIWWSLSRDQPQAQVEPITFLVNEQSTMRLDAKALGELVPQAGPASPVARVLYAPSGQWLASADLDGTVRLYDPSTELVQRVWATGQRGASVLAASTSGHWLAAGGGGDEVYLWDVRSGSVQQRLEGFGQGVAALALSPQGESLAVVGAGGALVTLWDVQSGQQRRVLGEVSPEACAVSFTPDGHSLVVVSRAADVQVVPLEGQGQVRSFSLSREVDTAAFSPDGRWLALAGQGSDPIWLVSLEDGAVVHQLSGHQGGVSALSFAQGGLLASASRQDRLLRTWDVARGQPQATLKAEGPGTWSVALSPDGQQVAAARQGDERAWLWSLGQPEAPVALPHNDGPVHALALDPGGERLATAGGASPQIQIWDSRRGALRATLKGHSGGVSALDWGEGDKLLSASAQEPRATLWDMRRGSRLFDLTQARGAVRSLGLSAGSRWAALGDQEGFLHVFSTQSGQPRSTVFVHEGPVLALAWHPEEEWVATAGQDALIHIWKLDNTKPWKTLKGHSGPVTALSWSPSGDALLSGGADGAVRLWSQEGTLEKTWEDHQGAVWDVAWSPDESLFGSVGGDRALRLRDPEGRMTGQIRRQHASAPRQVAFSPRGGWVATGAGSLLVQALAGDEWWRIWRPGRGWLHVWNDGRFACQRQGCGLYKVRMKGGRLAGARDSALKSLRRP